MSREESSDPAVPDRETRPPLESPDFTAGFGRWNDFGDEAREAIGALRAELDETIGVRPDDLSGD